MGEVEIQRALEKIPYSIAVVTVGRGGVENALTVSWLSQVSFEPPMLMFAVDKVHYSEEFLRTTRNFVVNLLPEDGKRLASHFAREAYVGEDKLATVQTTTADSGAKILEDALAWYDCEVKAIYPAGDHLIVIGHVEAGGVLREGVPLTTSSGLRYQKSRARRTAARAG